MSDSTNPLNQVSQSAIQREVTMNENFAQVSGAALFGYNSVTSSGLTWGYMGGRYGGTSVASSTVALTTATTNYLVAHRSTLAVTVATNTTNWDNTATYGRLYKVVAGASTVTSYEDHRSGPTGIFDTAASSGDMVLASVQTVTGVKTFGTAGGAVSKLAIAGSTSGSMVLNAPAAATGTAVLPINAGNIGYLEVPQNSQSTAYTTVMADSGKHLLHPAADTTPRTFTIDSNANVAYPIGTAITFVNENSAGTLTIAITSDTMRLAGAGTTGSRTLAANGIATALKITSTSWIISGTGLT
jgi:hypothetical protein